VGPILSPCLPQPVAALGDAALTHLEAHLLQSLDLLEDEELERPLAREHSAAVAARAALRPRAPDLSDLFDGPLPDLRLPDGGRLVGLPGGGARLLDAAETEHKRLDPLEVGPWLARVGLRAPGLVAAVAAWAEGHIDADAALSGWERVPRGALPTGPGRALHIDELRAPTGWPRAVLLHEPGDLPDAIPPLLLEGGAVIDQLDRLRTAEVDPELCEAAATLRVQLLRGPAPAALLPHADELPALWSDPAPLHALLAGWSQLSGQTLRVPEAGHLQLEVHRAGELPDTASSALFSAAGLQAAARLRPGTPVAAWAWVDDAGRQRVRFELAARGPAGWRFMPKPWRAWGA
jgi:hypothetical protein